MQLSRVAIAAVFLVVGALILIPMLMDNSSPSQLTSATPSPTATVPPPISPSRSAKPSKTPTHKPSPTRTTKNPVTPPAPSVTPNAPLRVSIGTVRCPGRSVLVSVTNHGDGTEDYAITTDGSISVADRIAPGTTRRSTLTVKEDHATTIAVTWHNIPVKSLDRTAHCARNAPGHALPHTGPDSGMIIARIATGVAALLTGLIIFWYGRLWPGRREKMFGDKE